mmetsp:Transcript_46282/g.74222  ORF Transcript_46282/g.74222 Transcript_46282/m.74222 type:complete len:91 (-) Transcript_46282:990-1262(-)
MKLMMMQKLYQSELKMESVCRAVRTQKKREKRTYRNEKKVHNQTIHTLLHNTSTSPCIPIHTLCQMLATLSDDCRVAVAAAANAGGSAAG